MAVTEINRIHIRSFLCASLCAVGMFALYAPALGAESWTKTLAEGVTLTQIVEPSEPECAPPAVNVLEVDPRAPGIKVRAALGRGAVIDTTWAKGREAVSSIAKRHDAVAAVNAGYFWQTGDPLGLHISGGELISEPWPGRVAVGITSNGRALFDQLRFDGKLSLPDNSSYQIKGINRSRGKNEMLVYTSRYHTSTLTDCTGSEAVVKYEGPVRAGATLKGTVVETKALSGDTPIPEGMFVVSGSGTASRFIEKRLTPGTEVSIRLDLKPQSPSTWDDVIEAVGAGPWLVRDSKVHVSAKEEEFKPDVYASSTCRTAIGTTADGKMVIATVGGWRRSGGMTLTRLAELMISRGCVNAINLDGGGSTTMAGSLGVLNSPAEGIERVVADAIIVTASGKKPAPVSSFAVCPPAGPVPSGTVFQCSLTDPSTGEPVDPALSEQAVWSVSGGIGFVDQSGKFHAIKARSGSVSASIGSVSATVPVEVAPGRPDRLSATLGPDASGAPNRSLVTITLTDLNGNPIKQAAISVSAFDGIPDAASITTDSDGKASTGITWHGAGPKASVTLEHSGLKMVVTRNE